MFTSRLYLYLHLFTISSLHTKTDTFENSVDPDETSYMDVHRLPLGY